MKSGTKILAAFILNLAFSIFEFIGGVFTGSIAIISDAIHDIGDAASIGVSYFLEKKSKRPPDEKYTYGYSRYSVLGGAINTLILLVGSATVIYNAMHRIIVPTEINYNGMILFAVVGVIVNSGAAFFTRNGESLNQKAVNLHMLEDVLGWIVVLVGAVVMKFTDIALLDPIMSVAVALFILFNAIKTLCKAVGIFLEKTPEGIDVNELMSHILKIEGVSDVHHVHIWSLDGQNNYATMHVVADSERSEIKESVREELREHGIIHSTLELEAPSENCADKHCRVEFNAFAAHHHHHHH
ncbi:MAG: cation transporter [Clostridia bacterium]|nr:cation transporter [Clostridia bacterium]